MTEQDWMAECASSLMVRHLRGAGKATDRKVQLWASACVRVIWPQLSDFRSQNAVDVADRLAEGLAGDDERESALRAVVDEVVLPTAQQGLGVETRLPHVAAYRLLMRGRSPAFEEWLSATATAAHAMTWESGTGTWPAENVFVRLVHDIFGNPFKPVTLEASWLTWNDGSIPRAAAAAYQERSLPSGHLDNTRLAVLADMLEEEAGCRDEEVLGHLRGPQAVHVRGCWCVDLLLGKD